jgi:hypothetical protein
LSAQISKAGKVINRASVHGSRVTNHANRMLARGTIGGNSAPQIARLVFFYDGWNPARELSQTMPIANLRMSQRKRCEPAATPDEENSSSVNNTLTSP